MHGGGSNNFNGLENASTAEGVYVQDGFSSYSSLPLLGGSLGLGDDLTNHSEGKAAIAIELQSHLGFGSHIDYSSHMMQEEPLHNPQISLQQFNWAGSANEIPEMKNHVHEQVEYDHHCLNSASYAEASAPPELLNLLQLPGCSAAAMLPLPVPPLNIFGELPPMQSTSMAGDAVLYNQLNFPMQPPAFRDLFHGLPHSYNMPGSMSGSCFDGVDARDANEGLFLEEDGRQLESSILDFRRGRGEVKGTQHHATEKQRRDQFGEKFSALRSLLPNTTKTDRATTLSDAIEYIKELLGTVEYLKMLVKKKRFQRERSRWAKTEDEMATDIETSSSKLPPDGEQSLNGPMRSSWVLRRSKETSIDVRIINDEVNIKLTQRRRLNCLLLVAQVLDELHMELLHATGGNIGDSNVLMFNTKISEGSSLYASAIAQKLMEVLEGQQPTKN